MGSKGDKMQSRSVETTASIMDTLESIPGITMKKMFGGHGIFCDQRMFLIVDSAGLAFFKVTDTTKAKFKEHNSVQHSKMPYFSIPDVVLNDSANLKEWALMVIQSIK